MARILVADDDVQVLRSVERVLSSAGHEVHTETQGALCLDAAAAQPFDVAVVDYNLGKMDGLEVLQRMRDIQPRCVRMLMTGELALPLVITAVNVGKVARVIEKPFEANTLVETVREALKNHNRLTAMLQSQQSAGSTTERRQLATLLKGDGLKLAIQPIMRASTNTIFGYELLLRSTHSTLDGPGPVLAAAERHGMLRELGSVVVARSVEWLMRIPEDRRIFLNLHPQELMDATALSIRMEVLEFWADRVVLEITERSEVGNDFSWEGALERVKKMGFQIAVDDLGSGYAALSMLAELQPHYMKVDMSIVRDVDKDDHKRRLVDLLCSFAEATGSEVVAEGVETPEEEAALLDAGVDLLQGFLFGEPSLTLNA
jgi:EAL domain-containing protein (putative c-di-GMP-specific phosphodiesterase class I)